MDKSCCINKNQKNEIEMGVETGGMDMNAQFCHEYRKLMVFVQCCVLFAARLFSMGVIQRM